MQTLFWVFYAYDGNLLNNCEYFTMLYLYLWAVA